MTARLTEKSSLSLADSFILGIDEGMALVTRESYQMNFHAPTNGSDALQTKEAYCMTSLTRCLVSSTLRL